MQETAAAAVGARLYVIGGYNAGGASTPNVFVFDGSSWASGPALPEAVNHPAAATLGTTVYVAGGFTAGGATARVFALPAGATVWQAIAPLRRARGALVLVADRGRLIAAGGNDGAAQVAGAEAYDPATNAWTDLPPLPHPRNHAAGFPDNGQVCLAGGREPSTSAAVDCLDPAGSWTAGQSLPTATSGAAGGMVDGITVVAGGEPAGETSLTTVVQEQMGGTWSQVPMLTPRHGTGYALYQGRLWMCGGATAPGIHATAACTSIGA
ncbi:MAG TPA: hypothetical protein VFW71_11865 [Actinomycetota bacterium]|nr:hypothetical protein [Actinomycetota bacterium]